MYCASFKKGPVPLNKQVKELGTKLNLIELLLSKRVFCVLSGEKKV
jgi:hypothetical protein